LLLSRLLPGYRYPYDEDASRYLPFLPYHLFGIADNILMVDNMVSIASASHGR